jgi:hypothetical protein
VLKDVLKGAGTAASAWPGPLQDFYSTRIASGVRDELARLTLTRKDHRGRAAPMEDRREIRSDEVDNASLLEPGWTSRRRGSSYPAEAPCSGTVVREAVSTESLARPAVSRGTRLTLGPLAEPKEASGRLSAESQIEPWFAF